MGKKHRRRHSRNHSFDQMRAWAESPEGKKILKKSAEEARKAGRELSESLVVPHHIWDQPMDY